MPLAFSVTGNIPLAEHAALKLYLEQQSCDLFEYCELTNYGFRRLCFSTAVAVTEILPSTMFLFLDTITSILEGLHTIFPSGSKLAFPDNPIRISAIDNSFRFVTEFTVNPPAVFLWGDDYAKLQVKFPHMFEQDNNGLSFNWDHSTKYYLTQEMLDGLWELPEGSNGVQYMRRWYQCIPDEAEPLSGEARWPAHVLQETHTQSGRFSSSISNMVDRPRSSRPIADRNGRRYPEPWVYAAERDNERVTETEETPLPVPQYMLRRSRIIQEQHPTETMNDCESEATSEECRPSQIAQEDVQSPRSLRDLAHDVYAGTANMSQQEYEIPVAAPLQEATASSRAGLLDQIDREVLARLRATNNDTQAQRTVDHDSVNTESNEIPMVEARQECSITDTASDFNFTDFQRFQERIQAKLARAIVRSQDEQP